MCCIVCIVVLLCNPEVCFITVKNLYACISYSLITTMFDYVQAQQEMSVMQNWMIGSGYADEEPFVMIDWVSGRLRPLYFIDVSYDSNSGEANEGDQIFNPSMLDLVLSPQQKRACDFALAANSQVQCAVQCSCCLFSASFTAAVHIINTLHLSTPPFIQLCYLMLDD